MSKHQNQFSSKILSMGILEISLISFLVTLYSPVFSSASSGNDEHCSNFFCGSDPTLVRYPFKFLNQSNKECGIPGFDLGCDSGENISLNLPNSGEFSVEYIDYYNQGIQLRDPQGCLPGRLLKLLSNSSTSSPFSPFSGEYYNNYTFFRCRNYSNPLWNPTLPIITCLSNPDAFVIASSASDFAIGMPSLCNLIGSVSVPQSRTSVAAADDIAANDFTLSLSWKDPDCLHCIARGGFCRFAGKTVCTINEASSLWKRWEKFLKIVGFSIFLPLAILPVFFFTVLLCLGGFRRRGDRRRNLAGSSRALRVAEMIRQLTAKPGLDERVIESYPKMVVDERLGNVGRDVMCCICLDEYVAGEMLRSLPDCRHCFHVECIDEWLKINRTCPICRI